MPQGKVAVRDDTENIWKDEGENGSSAQMSTHKLCPMMKRPRLLDEAKGHDEYKHAKAKRPNR